MLFRTFKFYLLFLSTILYSQSGLENTLLAGQTDSKNLLSGYLQPALKGSIYLMNSGWYTTAKVHKKLGFDLTISLNSAIIPENEKSFDISNFDFIQSKTSSLPTIFGKSINEELTVTIPVNNDQPQISSSFLAPGGIKDKFPLGIVSSPIIQATLGLPFKSEISIRYLPEYNRNRVYFSNYGIGFKHDILQYFTFLKKIPSLNLSAFGAYSIMSINYDIQSSNRFRGNNQIAEFDITNYKLQILSSFNFKIFEFYGGIGISGGNSSFSINGEYEVDYIVDGDSNTKFPIKISDPVKINYSIHELSKNFGFKFKFLFLHAFIDYTFQEYDVVTIGTSINFR
ncbi:MAG: hypothetical protein CND00_03815 [Cryomorphaceae bacterium MED-G14]|nr:MAG: hypothetical protein CND00_03815 [Cryomorphaceae bacterium MED-G14]